MKGSQSLLIDGPNVIHASPELMALARRDRDAARARLVVMAQAIRDGRDWKVIVVFDGRGPTVNTEAVQDDGDFLIIHTSDKLSGDDVIEHLVGRSGTPELFRVVSADRALRSTVSATGAEVMGPEDFMVWSAQAAAQLARRQSRRLKDSEAQWQKR
jgi:hypothetical protein